MRAALKPLNLALRFLLELCALAAFAYWGYVVGSSRLTSITFALLAPLVVAVIWAIFAAPTAARRLADPWLLLFEIAVFGLAALALVVTGHPWLGAGLGVLAALNDLLLFLWGQRQAFTAGTRGESSDTRS